MPKLPPETVPDGLSAEEYNRLWLLYMIMGRTEQAADANRRCAPPLSPEELEATPLSQRSTSEQMAFGAALGRDFASDLQTLMQEAAKDPTKMDEGLKKV